MENNKARPTKLPDNWDDMTFAECVWWFGEYFDTDESEEDIVYDVESMSEEILQAYKDVILYREEMKEKGILLD